MTFTEEPALDPLDRAILAALVQDARSGWSELAAQTGVSAPTIRERVRRLIDSGVIRGFTAEISPQALGYRLEAVVRFRPLPGKRHILEQRIQETDRIVQCDKVTGEDGFVARILLRDIGELDPLLETFARMATTHTSIVKSSPVRMRPPAF
ncbi:Lrp/AsnC family transcriptional regulator [Ruegeria pomeroyi]|uniref:Transcriptional regulator, AsnC family n=2 Tax=Ruegeria pomeroyi TaxID=89184 RepID=Q5LQ72_RUEPO|nr:Lrp/AsnC family transcriptional regulator [Ruegeria pomeroyi]HCE70907.1 Lrp/AsnC family transcriptional regulator [Ruegeria sp.]AAV95869.1 transcriptional regulator, AsnC family [Ruegeria pomeroyi DSS-3]NVK98265.1 Lrp/AsnC family transcriptional regulator [Ruegeria pomeroyi]NVK99749.1 Lrp/AsnC family transcriptional regulator [Ruegeria pomeroyi]QWV09438.1 Lrp/AsnC family transcriptional regulator [Ruegeria pomeroyi]